MKWLFLAWITAVCVLMIVNMACAPAAKIGTGLDCWPEDCREEEDAQEN